MHRARRKGGGGVGRAEAVRDGAGVVQGRGAHARNLSLAFKRVREGDEYDWVGGGKGQCRKRVHCTPALSEAKVPVSEIGACVYIGQVGVDRRKGVGLPMYGWGLCWHVHRAALTSTLIPAGTDVLACFYMLMISTPLTKILSPAPGPRK